MNVAQHLRSSSAGLALEEALQQPVASLLGVSPRAADALQRIGVKTIFDLGSSWLLANAAAAIEAASGRRDITASDLLHADVPVVAPDDIASLPLERLRGMSTEDATAIKQALELTTLREFALWPPRTVAQQLVREATGATSDLEEEQTEALRPRLGEYPTERVYYDTLVMLGMGASADRRPLAGAISLQPSSSEPAGFGEPAVGALVTFAQSWYAKGITLGHMLHSLALAPGEATRIAVVDWSRRTRVSVAETIEEAERLDQATEHSRAISEVQNAVANEMQEGESMTSGWAKSESEGSASAGSIGGGIAGAFKGVTGVLGFGGGMSSTDQSATTQTRTRSSSWSIGSRSVVAEMAQRVNDRTEQHATSVRNRRASSVREVAQSEHEQVSTRIVANYNHMHALTVQYYEVVQIYRVVAQVHAVRRVLFLPFELLDFTRNGADDVVARFRAQLLAAALTTRVRALLLDDRGTIEIRPVVRVRVPIFAGDLITHAGSVVAPARLIADGGATGGGGAGGPGGSPAPSSPPAGNAPPPSGGMLTAPGPSGGGRRIARPGPVLDTLPSDAALAAIAFDDITIDRVRIDRPGVPASDTTLVVPAATNQLDLASPIPMRTIEGIYASKTVNDADTGTMTLRYDSGGAQFTLSVPIDLSEGTSLQKVAYLATDPTNRKEELITHLQANRAYYTRAVLSGLDSASIVMLLSAYTWRGKPLADQVEPHPLAVAGNFLVLRAPVEPHEPAGIGEGGPTWGQLLHERALTSEQQDGRLVPIPTGGVFAEAVLGRSNSAEKLDITRFWNWQDSPIPLQPPDIAPVGTGTRATPEDLRPGQLSAPLLNIVNPTALPDPAGLTAALGTLRENLFRDMSGLAGTQALAQGAVSGTLAAASEAGQLTSANLKTVTDQAVAMGQTAADMWKTLHSAKGGGGSGSGGGGISGDGARINHGRDMDRRGVSRNGSGGGASAASTDGGFRVTESQAEFQAAGGGSGDRMSEVAAPTISRELAFADTAAAGVSPALLSGTVQALGVTPAAATSGIVGAITGPLGTVGHVILEMIALAIIRHDVELSGKRLTNIKLLPMRTHRHGEKFKPLFAAWTNSHQDVYVNLEKFFELITDSIKKNVPAAEALLFARGAMVPTVRHELIHSKQFSAAKKPPGSFQQMVGLEMTAYGCASAKVKDPDSTWVTNTGTGGALDFLTTKMGLAKDDAQSIVDDFADGAATNCGYLDTITATIAIHKKANVDDKDIEKAVQRGLIAHQLLPTELVKGQGHNYAIDDLYKTP